MLVSYFKKYKVEWLVASVLLAGVFAVFHEFLWIGFLSDDYHLLSVVGSGMAPWKYFLTNIIGTRGGSSYGPVLDLLFFFQYQLFGLHASWYHTVSVAFHALNAFFVFLLVRKMAGERFVGMAAALLFLFLPNRTEAVAWISSQPHVIGTTGYIAGLYFYLVFITEKKWRHYGLALASITLSLFTKEIGITFLAAWLLLDVLYREKELPLSSWLWRLVKRFALPVLMLVVYLLLRQYATGYVAGYYGSATLTTNLRAMGTMAFEITASMFVPHPGRGTIAAWVAARWEFVFISMVGMGVLAWKKCPAERRAIVFFIIGYGVALLPFLQLMFNPHHNGGERYTYLPSIYIVSLVAITLYALLKRWRYPAVYAGVIGLILIPCIGLLEYKEGAWVAAGNVSRRITATYEAVPMAANDIVLFVGLPDSVDGAEVFRNAIKEALTLHGYTVPPESERIPLYTVLGADTAAGEVVRLEKRSDHEYALVAVDSTKTRIFTGFAVFQHPAATFTLEAWQRGDTGTAIRIDLHPDVVDALAKEGQYVRLVYYNKGQLESVILE